MDIIYYRIQVLYPTLGRWISCTQDTVLYPTLGRWISCTTGYKFYIQPWVDGYHIHRIQSYIQPWVDGYHVLQDTSSTLGRWISCTQDTVLYPTLERWISCTQNKDLYPTLSRWILDIKYYKIQFYSSRGRI